MSVIRKTDVKIHPIFTNYFITRDGRVWSITRKDSLGRPKGGLWLKPFPCPKGYLYVNIWQDGRSTAKRIHNLVLETYVESRPRGKEGCHNDGNKNNNNLSNLRWATHKENEQDKIKHGKLGRGQYYSQAKLKEKDVILIFNAYHDGAYTIKELAGYFGRTYETIYQIVKKKRWKYLWAK